MKSIVHVEDMNTHSRKAIGFNADSALAMQAKMDVYFTDRPHLRIVCIDEN